MSEDLKTISIAPDRIRDLYDVYMPLWLDTKEAFEETWKWIPERKYGYDDSKPPMRILSTFGSSMNTYRLQQEYMPYSPIQLFFPQFR